MVTKTTKAPAPKKTTTKTKKAAATFYDRMKKVVRKKAIKKEEVLVDAAPAVAIPKTETAVKIPTPKLTDVKLPVVQKMNPYLGCDPEFFFKLDGIVIGAEKVFKKDGLLNTTDSINDRCVLNGAAQSKFIIDGVQAELNPRPNTCRANLANEIAACFKTLQAELKKQGKGVSVDLSRSITLTDKELASLDKENQKLGCMPSNSIYQNAGVKLTDIDGTKHMQRSAGGHIHIGTEGQAHLKTVIEKEADTLVQMLDLICGNTCVLVDRDEGNKERRKLYGRAGEYRLPKHGLEYRTLSNFWLESYYLMSLAFGTARIAVELVADRTNGKRFVEAFLGAVDKEDVQKAINENDFDLAYSNFKRIEPLLVQVTSDGAGDHFPLSKGKMPAFHYFVKQVKEKGLKHYFTQDPITHWTTLPECHGDGFHHFLRTKIADEIREKRA